MNQHSTAAKATTRKVTIHDIFQQSTRQVESLLAQLEQAAGSNRDYADEIAELQRILETLPLSTGEFGVATNRVRNASRYLRSQERGAARYELKMLARSLGPKHDQDGRPSPEVGTEQLARED